MASIPSVNWLPSFPSWFASGLPEARGGPGEEAEVRSPSSSLSGLTSSWPRPNRWLQRRLLATQHPIVTWQKKLAVTKPENKYTDLSRWKDIALVKCVFWPGCWQSCSGAHLHSCTTPEGIWTGALVSQSFDPQARLPCASRAPPPSILAVQAAVQEMSVLQRSGASETYCSLRCWDKLRCSGPTLLWVVSLYLHELGLLSTKFGFFSPHLTLTL